MYKPRVQLDIGAFCVRIKDAPPLPAIPRIYAWNVGNYTIPVHKTRPAPGAARFEAGRILEHIDYI